MENKRLFPHDILSQKWFEPDFIEVNQVLIHHPKRFLADQQVALVQGDLGTMVSIGVEALKKRIRDLNVAGASYPLELRQGFFRIG